MSYVSGRRIAVSVDNEMSHQAEISVEVGHELILGYLLFKFLLVIFNCFYL